MEYEIGDVVKIKDPCFFRSLEEYDRVNKCVKKEGCSFVNEEMIKSGNNKFHITQIIIDYKNKVYYKLWGFPTYYWEDWMFEKVIILPELFEKIKSIQIKIRTGEFK